MTITYEDRIKQLRKIKQKAMIAGGEEKIARHHEKGKLTARERLAYFLDPGSFVEFNMLLNHRETAPGDGIISGYGTLDGRVVCVYSQDVNVRGGSIGPLHGYKMYKTIERALEMGAPLVGLLESPGGRLPKINEAETVHDKVMEKMGDFRLLSQHAGLGSRSPDFGYHGNVRGDLRLLARPDGFHFHGG